MNKRIRKSSRNLDTALVRIYINALLVRLRKRLDHCVDHQSVDFWILLSFVLVKIFFKLIGLLSFY